MDGLAPARAGRAPTGHRPNSRAAGPATHPLKVLERPAREGGHLRTPPAIRDEMAGVDLDRGCHVLDEAARMGDSVVDIDHDTSPFTAECGDAMASAKNPMRLWKSAATAGNAG